MEWLLFPCRVVLYFRQRLSFPLWWRHASGASTAVTLRWRRGRRARSLWPFRRWAALLDVWEARGLVSAWTWSGAVLLQLVVVINYICSVAHFLSGIRASAQPSLTFGICSTLALSGRPFDAGTLRSSILSRFVSVDIHLLQITPNHEIWITLKKLRQLLILDRWKFWCELSTLLFFFKCNQFIILWCWHCPTCAFSYLMQAGAVREVRPCQQMAIHLWTFTWHCLI